MKKFFLLQLIAGFALIASAQTDPSIVSWIINVDSLSTGSYYVSGSSTPTSTSLLADILLVQYSDSNVYINCNGIPSYPIGPYLDGNPSQAGEQGYLFRIPRYPQPQSGTPASPGLGHIGVLINGIPIYNASDAMSYNNQGIWNRDAIYYENDGFDCSKGHPAPKMGAPLNEGLYHHHQNPIPFDISTNPASNVCTLYPSTSLYNLDSTQHSPLIGFAFDGYPIYGSYAYADTMGGGGIKRMESSYQPRNITQRTTLPDGTVLQPSQYGPAVSATYPLGAFIEDYEYIAGSGDLDEHNGRFCITPEYPNGTYAYFATVDAEWNSQYPYFVGPEYYGEVASDNFQQGSNLTTVVINEPVTVYNPATSREDALFDSQIQVYPNPARDQLHVKFISNSGGSYGIRLISLDGKICMEKQMQVSPDETIDIEPDADLPAGIYMLVINVPEGRVMTQKIQIEK